MLEEIAIGSFALATIILAVWKLIDICHWIYTHVEVTF